MSQYEDQEDHVYRDYVTVGDAAALLGVSIDTVRRWEKSGKLSAERIDGKNRYFAVDELESFKSAQPLSSTEVAVLLGVSPSTVRRLDESGQLPSVRDEKGKRQYDRASVETYAKGESSDEEFADSAATTSAIPHTAAPVMAAEAAALPAINEEPLMPHSRSKAESQGTILPGASKAHADKVVAPSASSVSNSPTPSNTLFSSNLTSQRPSKGPFKLPRLQLHIRQWAPWQQAVFSLAVIFIALVM